MYYTIYQTANLITKKIYVGSHITSNLEDDYLGSGKILIRSISKYGKESFSKTVLHIFDNIDDMFAKETEIVNEAFIRRKDTYNIKLGGQGGWDYVNSSGLNWTMEKNNRISGFKNVDPRVREQWAKLAKPKIDTYWKEIREGKRLDSHPHRATFSGKHHSSETKKKMSDTHKSNGHSIGEKNSQHGTCWITNGIKNKKIKKTDLESFILEGWKKGRTFTSPSQ